MRTLNSIETKTVSAGMGEIAETVPEANEDMAQPIFGGQLMVSGGFDGAYDPYFEAPYGLDAGYWSDAEGKFVFV